MIVIVIVSNNPGTVAQAPKRAQQADVNRADLSEAGTMMLDTISEQIGGAGQIAALVDNATATNHVAWVRRSTELRKGILGVLHRACGVE